VKNVTQPLQQECKGGYELIVTIFVDTISQMDLLSGQCIIYKPH